MKPKNKLIRCTAAQIKFMSNYMALNPHIIQGDYSGPAGARKLLGEWELLKNHLKKFGPDKSINQWKQTWKDLQKKQRRNPEFEEVEMQNSQEIINAMTKEVKGDYVVIRRPPRSNTTKKLTRSTNAQLEILINYMSDNPHIIHGNYSGPMWEKLDIEWTKLKNILKEHGPDKTLGQWKQTWKDLKKKARTEYTVAIERDGSLQNDERPPISDSSRKILSLIGYDTIKKHKSSGRNKSESFDPLSPSASPSEYSEDGSFDPSTLMDTSIVVDNTAEVDISHDDTRLIVPEQFVELQQQQIDVLKELVGTIKTQNRLLGRITKQLRYPRRI